MTKITEEIKESLKATKIEYLATATKDGVSTVVLSAAFKFLDDKTLLIPDRYFGKTINNPKENPKIALTLWGDKDCFQMKADITIHTDDDIYREDVR